MDDQSDFLKLGYDKSISLLKECSTKYGFVASTSDVENYKRIWGRDGCIMSAAALLSDDDDMIKTVRKTLETLMKHQGPHGEIPSNYDPKTNRVSYGGTAGRVDADLWFLICCGLYLRKTKDEKFIRKVIEAVEKVRFLLGAWEYNNRGLLYIPITGDWADEYIHHGYVLFDQLLYYRALHEVCAMHNFLHKSSNHKLEGKVAALKHTIRANYWFNEEEPERGDIYHKVLYDKGKRTAAENKSKYWYSFFTPAGYGYRFDTLANIFVSLFGIANEKQSNLVDKYIEDEVAPKEMFVLPAFHPVITPKDENWKDLKMSFSYTFKNKPYEYHNGGLWCMVTGFYVADLARRGKKELAEKYLSGIHHANKMKYKGAEWSFPEFIDGKKFTPGGMDHLGWSAAAAVIAHHALDDKHILPVHKNDEVNEL